MGTGAFLGRRFQIYLCRIIAQEDWFCQTKSPAGHSLGQARTEKTAGALRSAQERAEETLYREGLPGEQVLGMEHRSDGTDDDV